MNAWTMRRSAALAAVGFVVLFVVSTAIAGTTPNVGAAPSKIATYFDDHHKAIEIGVVLVGIALVLLVLVLAQVVDLLRSAMQGDVAVAFSIGGAAFTAVLAAGIALYGACGQLAAGGSGADIVRSLYRVSEFVFVPLYWLGLTMVIPLAVAAVRGALPRWSLRLNVVVAVLLVLGGISVRGGGALAVGTGALAWVGALGLLVLVLELGGLLWQASVAPTREAASSMRA
jgi:hypothetical protein